MADSATTAPEVTEPAEGLHRTLSKLFAVLRRGDSSRAATGYLTLAHWGDLFELLFGP